MSQIVKKINTIVQKQVESRGFNFKPSDQPSKPKNQQNKAVLNDSEGSRVTRVHPVSYAGEGGEKRGVNQKGGEQPS